MKKVLVALCAGALTCAASAELIVKSGDKVAFLGDSITQFGNDPGGYVRLVMKGFETLGVEAKKIAAGTSGNTSREMLARLNGSVLKSQPQFMTLSCGVNDVWHGAKGVKLEDFKKNVTEILDRCQAAKVEVIVMTATIIGEDHPDSKQNARLVAYNDFLRETAKARGLRLADVSAELLKGLEGIAPKHGEFHFTRDGTHMAWAGNVLLARTLMKTFGATDVELAKLEEVWRKMPGTSHVTAFVSRESYERFARAAGEKGLEVSEYVAQELERRAK